VKKIDLTKQQHISNESDIVQQGYQKEQKNLYRYPHECDQQAEMKSMYSRCTLKEHSQDDSQQISSQKTIKQQS
jgi:hypothetical protein